MQSKDLKIVLILLVIFQLGLTSYYMPGNFRYLFQVIQSLDLQDGLFTFTNILNNLITIAMLIVGIIGVVLFFVKKNDIFNKALTIYLIHHTFTLFAFMPRRLILMFDPPGSFSFAWYHHLFYLISIITIILTAIVFAQRKLRPLPKAVTNKGPRFVNRLLDAMYLNMMVLNIVSYFMSGFYSFGSRDSSDVIIGYVLMLLFPFLYYFITESIFKQTIGKVITGTYVMSKDGRRAPILNVLGRTLCRYIPFEPFSYLVDEGGRWHDRFSGTDLFYKSNVLMEEMPDPVHDEILDSPY